MQLFLDEKVQPEPREGIDGLASVAEDEKPEEDHINAEVDVKETDGR